MVTEVYAALTAQEKHEMSKYGVTVVQMREAVAESIRLRHGTAARMANSIIADCVTQVEHADDMMVAMDIRQALNRASWIITNYLS